MRKLALIGKNISHSKSQEVYESILREKVDYSLLDIPEAAKIPQLEELFDVFDGVSVTSPYKGFFTDRVLVRHKALVTLNSLNCLRKKEGSYEGTSTDFLGLQDIFEGLKRKWGTFRVALLGDGSMSRLTRFILQEMGVEHEIFSRRSGTLAPDTNLEKVFPSDKKFILINSCGRGFVFRGKVPKETLFWDYNYAFGAHEEYWKDYCSYQDGYSLLELQAKYALNFWNGR